jgi:curved DNA-binding protein CbpA
MRKSGAPLILLLLLFQLQNSQAGWIYSSNEKENSPYNILGLSRKSTSRDIKKAYRKLSLLHHPDRNPGDTSATETFARLVSAHDILSDSRKREIYDRLGHAGLERLKDEDPTVEKDFVPPDDGLTFLDRFIQRIFSSIFGNTDWDDL